MSRATFRSSLSDPLGPVRLRLTALACLLLSWVSFNRLDEPVMRFLSSWPHPWLTQLFHFINAFGGTNAGYLVLAASLLTLWYRPMGGARLMALARSLALGLPLVIVSGALLKWAFSRPRPPLFLENGSSAFLWFEYAAHHTSMPSMHAGRAFCFAVALGWAYPRLRNPALAAACLIALGRVMVLRHYPSDVLAGTALALVVMSFIRPRLFAAPEGA